MFSQMVDFMMSQDINSWERKALINERFFKTQHLCRSLYGKIRKNRDEMREIHTRVQTKAEYNARLHSSEVRTTKDEILKTINKSLDDYHEMLQINQKLIKKNAQALPDQI